MIGFSGILGTGWVEDYELMMRDELVNGEKL